MQTHLSLYLFFLIQLLILNYSLQTNCGSFTPNSAGQCNNFSTDNSYCCYITQFENNVYSSICYSIPISSYRDVVNTGHLKLGVAKYTIIDCGKQVVGTTCGPNKPYTPKDCDASSISSSNCCLYTAPNGEKGCAMSGNTLKSYYTTTNGFSIICLSRYINVSWIMLGIVLGIIMMF